MNTRFRTAVIGGVMVVGFAALWMWPTRQSAAPAPPTGDPTSAPSPSPSGAARASDLPSFVDIAAARAPSAPAAAPAPTGQPVAAQGKPARTPDRPLPSLLGPGFGNGEAPGNADAPEQFLANHSAGEVRLLGLLARQDLVAPPAMDRLFEMRRGGASEAELLTYMRRNFPADLRLRQLTLQWIESDETGARKRPPVKLSTGGRPPQGSIGPASPTP